jgi:hypothetical protein
MFLAELFVKPADIDELAYLSFSTEIYFEPTTYSQQLDKVEGVFWQLVSIFAFSP